MIPDWLKLNITPQNKLWSGAFVGIWVTLLYGAVGRLTLLLQPEELEMTAWDHWIPFIPWTFWIYVSVNLIYISSCVLQTDLLRLRVFLLAYLLAYSSSGIFFLLYPTIFPRHLFPLDAQHGLTAQSLTIFRTIDQPTNCLPSMHVASAVLCTIPFYGRRPRLFSAFAVWAALITVSTLTTKQHYAVDLFWGGTLGFVCYAVSFCLLHPGRLSLTSLTSTNEKILDVRK